MQSITALAYSPTGNFIASASKDKTVVLLLLLTELTLYEQLRMFSAKSTGRIPDAFILFSSDTIINAMTFTPDGRHLILGCKDHTVRSIVQASQLIGSGSACERKYRQPAANV